jgi:integral membrane protein
MHSLRGLLNKNHLATKPTRLQTIKTLRFIGIAEGISFLVLLLVAMPLKYFAGLPLAVKVVGWAHGVLFVLYIGLVLAAIRPMKWRVIDVLIAWAASFIPAGTFFLDKSFRRRISEMEAQPARTV